ncbi:MAG: hypothetical protein KDB10_20440 [Acidimicrobiales bacterium]|nr:hypothetical protein [Acidimicrobiales bacterium]MCB9373304.1 hypothetical protein [Microthrixaceae bacterium]
MATAPPADLELTPLDGDGRPLAEWLTTFRLVAVVVDPFTWESSWLLETAGRILRTFADADCRTAFVVTGNADEARQFLGPWTERILTFTDPDRAAVRALGLEQLPAFVNIAQDGTLAGVAEGWQPDEWRAAAQDAGRVLGWSTPVIPANGDPGPFEGSPALGTPADA